MVEVKPTALSEPFTLTRLGMLMAPEPDSEHEVEGVLNPALVRGPDGDLYLFPRLVAAGNYSRIGISKVIFDASGNPVGVERLGIALEPQEPYEKNPWTGGGVEDPRITFVEVLDCYVMTYTAFSEQGPRIALAISKDLLSWDRLGLVEFGPSFVDFGQLHNKDAVLFPSLVPGPLGAPSLAMIHRPLFPNSVSGESWGSAEPEPEPSGTSPAARRFARGRAAARRRRPHGSIWISYCPTPRLSNGLRFDDPRRILSPRASWERLKVGAGTPPVRTPLGWLLLYHGVSGNALEKRLRYSAGAMVLDAERPHRVLYRSPRPILSPGPDEQTGIVPNVVFPTGLDQRVDIGQPDRIDVYFGMADDRIGVATMRVPAALSAGLDAEEQAA